MLETVLILIISRFMEIVHVQLPDEGRKIVVLEKFGENFFCKFVRLPHYKTITILVPADNVVTGGLL